MTIKLLFILLAGIGITLPCRSQDSRSGIEKITSFPSQFVGKVNNRITSLEAKLDKQAAKYLARLKRRESKLRKKVARKDSLAAAIIFENEAAQYNNLAGKLTMPQKYKDYYPYLDTLATSLHFIDQQKILSSGQVPQKVQDALSHIKGLESQLHKAETVKQFLKERKQFLRDQLGKYGLGRELKKLNKDVYYYSQYINEYKSLLQNPEKLERKAIEFLTNTSVFQDFLRKHSFLASIFRVSGDPSNSAYQVNIAGLQTNAQVSQMIQQQFGTTVPNPVATLQQNIQQAQSQLLQLKDKITNLGGGGEDLEHRSFNLNNQKTKNFLKRIELGTNIQTQRATNYFPATSDVGLSLGYKLNDRSIVGIGMSYILGLGSGWRDIQLSSQGVGLRGFFDWKLKGSFWISGGYEMNYRSAFNDVDQLKNLDAWQQSGLVGVSKLVSLKTKFFKKTKLSLLWDILSYRQIPETKPVVIRVGYNF